MNRATAVIALISLPVVLGGCHSDTPKTAPVTQSPSSATTPPKPQDCDAIADPAKAEDCRFRAEVLKKRQASKASPVVTHDPGSIKQP